MYVYAHTRTYGHIVHTGGGKERYLIYDAAATRAISRITTRQVSGTGIKPTHARERNNVPTSNLSATGSRKLPSLEAWDVQVRAIHPSATSLSPANVSKHRAICATVDIIGIFFIQLTAYQQSWYTIIITKYDNGYKMLNYT